MPVKGTSVVGVLSEGADVGSPSSPSPGVAPASMATSGRGISWG